MWMAGESDETAGTWKAHGTGYPARFVVFGSFITGKPEPNDVDLFLIMDDAFNSEELQGEAALLFDHLLA